MIPSDATILITGITSMHGWPVYELFRAKHAGPVYGVYPRKMKKYFTHHVNVFSCDIEDTQKLTSIFNDVHPDVVIHAGGVCDLDLCEDVPEFAYEVNVNGARNIAVLAHNAYLVYISSDLVFSGNEPCRNGHTEDHMPDPVSIVGDTYVQAEHVIRAVHDHVIVRIGLPIGPSLSGTKGAVDFIEKRLKYNKPMTLFHDEVRSLIATDDLAQGIWLCVTKHLNGLFHFGGIEKYSLYDIGHFLIKQKKYAKEYLIHASRHDEIGGPPRIGDVSLNSEKFYVATGFVPSRVW